MLPHPPYRRDLAPSDFFPIFDEVGSGVVTAKPLDHTCSQKAVIAFCLQKHFQNLIWESFGHIFMAEWSSEQRNREVKMALVLWS